MLIPVEEYFIRSGVYDMPINELLNFRDKICDRIKEYEKNKYTERILELEVFMHPSPSVRYCWECYCLIEVCKIILTRKDCDNKLKDKCAQDIDEAYMKRGKGLYANEREAFQKYRELKGDI